MKKRVILFSLLLIFLSFTAFFIGGLYEQNDYSKSLIAVKYVDSSQYGEAFYAVEVIGKEQYGHIDVYAKIFISSLDSGYYHDCENIGTGENWTDARKQFGDVQYDGNGITIGSYRIERNKYENHR